MIINPLRHVYLNSLHMCAFCSSLKYLYRIPLTSYYFWYKRSATGHAALRCLPTSSHNSAIVLAGTGCLHDGALSW